MAAAKAKTKDAEQNTGKDTGKEPTKTNSKTSSSQTSTSAPPARRMALAEWGQIRAKKDETFSDVAVRAMEHISQPTERLTEAAWDARWDDLKGRKV